jgi:hypothetical protein
LTADQGAGAAASVLGRPTEVAALGCHHGAVELGGRRTSFTGVWDDWRKFDPRARFVDGQGGAAAAVQPCVSGVVEREAQLARACKTFAAGLAVQHQEEVPQYPMPAGDPDQIDWILDRAQQEFRVAALLAEVARVTGEPFEYRSIPAARKDPMWRDGQPGGIHAAVKSEIERVALTFEAIRPRSAAEWRAARAKYAGRFEDRKPVVVVTEKRSKDTRETARIKMRLAIADLVSLGEVKEKFSATVALGVVRFVANATLGRKGKLYTLDVAGAYLHGKPLTPEQGGRVLFAKVPPGFEQFGYYEFDPVTKEQNYFQVTGNLPGRQDAGLIWQVCNDKFLVDFGFQQSIVDRRCFYLHRGEETIIVCIYVDDSFIWCSDDGLWAEFYAAWSARFPPSEEGLKGASAADSAVAVREFCGLTISSKPDGSLEFSCGKLIADLARKLAPYPVPATIATPLKEVGLQELRQPPSEADPLIAHPAMVEAAMSIVGLGGWITLACRPDGLLWFIALAQQLATNFKRTTWGAVLRGAHYLVATADTLVLRFAPPADAGAWYASSDSSCINAMNEEGALAGSFHGWSLSFAGSGPVD